MDTKINLNEIESGDLIENAVKQSSASATEETSADENMEISPEENQPSVKKDEKIEEKHIPYSRFKEVNDELKRVRPYLEKIQELQKLGYELDDVLTTLKSSDSEEFSKIDVAKFKRELEDFKKKQAQIAEKLEFENLVKKHPEAIEFENEIKEIGRIKPDLTHEEIFEKYFKKAVKSKEIQEKISKKENFKVETGKGSGEDIFEGITLAQFNKLPLEKQKEYLKKMGL